MHGGFTTRRVLVLGPPGAGKSTLALQLGEKLGLPVHHLDHAFFHPGWVQVPHKNYVAEVGRIARLPAWVIDGNYTESLEPHLRDADLLIYLDLPPWITLSRIMRRTLNTYGRTRPDGPVDCPERLDLGFLKYAWNFNCTERAKILKFIEGCAGAKMILRDTAAIRRFVDTQPKLVLASV